MKLKSLAVILSLSLLIASSGIGQEPQLLTKPGFLPELYGIFEKPNTSGTHPAVVILYGSQGWRPIYAAIAKSLADSGFVALALDYYAYQGDESGETGDLAVWHRRQAAVRSAVTFLMDDPSVKKGSVGLLGYSLGAILSVSVAASIPEVKAVVNFFGCGSEDKDELESLVRNFPPLLILHGEEDQAIPVSAAYALRDAVLAQGGEVEMKIYPGVGHGFNGPWLPNYSEEYDIDSFQRTIDFFRRKL